MTVTKPFVFKVDAAVLAQGRVCASCRHVRHVGADADNAEPVCGHESEAHPLHWCQPVMNEDTFGCTYWQAREDQP